MVKMANNNPIKAVTYNNRINTIIALLLPK